MSAVSATNGAGVGFSVLEEIISGMDMPWLSNKTFLNYQNSLSELWNQEIERAIEENVREASKMQYNEVSLTRTECLSSPW